MMYWPVAMLVPQAVILELINGMVASIAIGLAVAYFPGVWRQFRIKRSGVTGPELLLLGITLVQVSLGTLYVWAWAFRYFGGPPWMEDHAFRGWIVYLLFLGGVLHLMAPGMQPVSPPPLERPWVQVGVMVAIGLGIGVLMLTVGTTR